MLEITKKKKMIIIQTEIILWLTKNIYATVTGKTFAEWSVYFMGKYSLNQV